MVYFVAAVVVLYNVEEQAQRHYLGHTADIKCMSVHPNKLLIATGQTSSALERPHVRIWNSVSLQTVHTLGQADFEHNICCVSFSKADGGNLLVAVEESDFETGWQDVAAHDETVFDLRVPQIPWNHLRGEVGVGKANVSPLHTVDRVA